MTLRLLLLILFLPATLWGQSLNLSVDSPTTNNSTDTFALNGGEVSFTDNSIRFLENGNVIQGYAEYGVSPDLSIVAVAHWAPEGNSVLIMNAAGDTLITYPTVGFSERDPSLALFPADNGSLVIRQNVSSFTFYNTFGESRETVIGGMQSEDGATMPRVMMDPAGNTVFIYTPRIRTGRGIGSGIQRVAGPGNSLEDIFYSEERSVEYAEVAPGGQFLVLVTARDGTDDRIVLLDRYGNRLTEIQTEEEVVGANLTTDGEYLTVYAERRVVIYSTGDGERIRSASSRAPLIRAQYFPEDEIILGVTGSLSEQSARMSDVEFYAVHLGRGEIARESLDSEIGFGTSRSGTAFSPLFRRNSAGNYTLLGGSKQVTVQTAF